MYSALFGYLIPHKNFMGKLENAHKDLLLFKSNYRLFLNAMRNGELKTTHNKPIPENFRITFNSYGGNPDLIVYAAIDLTAVLRQEMPLPDMTLALNWIEANGFSVVDKKPKIYVMPDYLIEDFFN